VTLIFIPLIPAKAGTHAQSAAGSWPGVAATGPMGPRLRGDERGMAYA